MKEKHLNTKMITQLPQYGIQSSNHHHDRIDYFIEDISHTGYVIIDSGFSSEEISIYAKKLDDVYEMQQQEVGGEENLTLINDANVVRCPLAYDDIFLKLAMHRVLLDIYERMLGANFVLLMQNGIINKPDYEHYQTRWHRDLNYQHWVCSQPLAISTLFCLDPFSTVTGGTHLLPGSHLKEKFPSEEYVKRHENIVEAKAGSIVIMDAMLFHCAGKNTSNMIRRAVNHVVGVPILGQQISIPDMLDGQYKEDNFLEKFLGYHWQPKQGVKQWRLARIEALKMNNV